jgi:type 1 fimbria pilin
VENTYRSKGTTMNRCVALNCFAALMLSALLALSTTAAQAQTAVLEIRGVITSPGCTLNQQTVAQLGQLSHISGQACGLTSGTANPMSSLNIAAIDHQTLLTSTGTAVKELVTFTYR